jgi:hypothetical protein
MPQSHLVKIVQFAAVFIAVTYIADWLFFTPSVGKSLVQGVVVAAVWGWCMKRWHWDKEKRASPER